MKNLLLLLLALGTPLSLVAQAQFQVEAQRARIDTERSQAQQQFAAQEIACYRKFAVNDCLLANREIRRERLADLRRQELVLNDAERKRRASDRVRSLEDRNAGRNDRQDAADRAESLERYRQRKADIEEKAAQRAAKEGSAATRTPSAAHGSESVDGPAGKSPPPRSVRRAAKSVPPHDTLEAQRSYDERQRAAQARRDRVQQRLAEPGRAQPLPVPP